MGRRMLIASVCVCFVHGKGLACRLRRKKRTKKRPHRWGHSLKEAKEGSQGRRCKGPLHPERLKERCREQRVKVIRQRPLFLLGEDALAQPKARPDVPPDRAAA